MALHPPGHPGCSLRRMIGQHRRARDYYQFDTLPALSHNGHQKTSPGICLAVWCMAASIGHDNHVNYERTCARTQPATVPPIRPPRDP